MEEDFKFEVGSTYTNMKGDYEVVSIQRDQMVIRWTDGSEIATTVDQQMRILERMAYEEEVAIKEKEKKQKKK